MEVVEGFVFLFVVFLVMAYFRWRREERFVQRILDRRDEKFFERWHR